MVLFGGLCLACVSSSNVSCVTAVFSRTIIIGKESDTSEDPSCILSVTLAENFVHLSLHHPKALISSQQSHVERAFSKLYLHNSIRRFFKESLLLLISYNYYKFTKRAPRSKVDPAESRRGSLQLVFL